MKKLTLFFTILLSTFWSYALLADELEIARVLVIPFVNESGQQHYEWLRENAANAFSESLQRRFIFTPVTIEEASEILPDDSPFKSMHFDRAPSSREAMRLCRDLNVDILIYGGYDYNERTNRIELEMGIFHASRSRTTGSFDTNTPITGEMFNIIDEVVDRAVVHLLQIAEEDYAVIQTLDVEESETDDTRTTLYSYPGPFAKPYFFALGVGYAYPAYFFDQGLTHGMELSFTYTNSLDSFWHYGVGVSFMGFLPAGFFSDEKDGPEDNENYFNMTEYMFFMPIIVQGGVNLRPLPFLIIQPSVGLGISFEAMKLGEEMVYYEGAPVREGEKWNFYVDPVAMAQIRVPYAIRRSVVALYIRSHFYVGKIEEKGEDKWQFGILASGGIEYMF